MITTGSDRVLTQSSLVAQTLARFQEIDGTDSDTAGLQWDDASSDAVRALIARRLVSGVDGETAVELGALLMQLDAARLADIDRRARVHSEQLASLRRVARSIGDNAERMSQAVTTELCTNLGYGKAMFSVVQGSTWSPVALAVNPALTGDFHDLITAIDGREISLHDAPREAELVRRRKSYAVDGVDTYRHTYRPLIDLSRPAGYLATPVVVDSRVVAIIHVDRQSDDLSDTDIDIVGTIAAMCAASKERAALRDHVATRNERIRAEIERLSADLNRSMEGFVANPFQGEPVRSTVSTSRHDSASARVPGTHALTAREAEVLSMIAVGATNAVISRKLCISDGTVKSHVQRIFKKLGVSTRAEAAALCADMGDDVGD